MKPSRGQHRAGQPMAPADQAVGAMASVLLLILWLGLLATGVWTGRLPLWALGALAGINLLTLITYAADKRAAQQGGWRTSEKHLHGLALAGGWPAAWLAQQRLRHKSRKKAFRAVYGLTVVLHCTGLAVWVFR